MAAETNVITTAQMAKVREVDFVRQFAHKSLEKLFEVLGVTRKIQMMEGTTMYVYSTTGTLEDGEVDEGDIIPLSEYETTKTAVGDITLKKWRKGVTAEAIKKSGYEAAIRDTDSALLRDVQAAIRGDLFSFLNGTIANSTAATGEGLQAALANAWAQLQVKFEDDTAEAVYFVNPLDVADYLAKANITTQTAFGMNYVENFLGLGTVIMSSRITRGTFVATAKQNLIVYYLTMKQGFIHHLSDPRQRRGTERGREDKPTRRLRHHSRCRLLYLSSHPPPRSVQDRVLPHRLKQQHHSTYRKNLHQHCLRT